MNHHPLILGVLAVFAASEASAATCNGYTQWAIRFTTDQQGATFDGAGDCKVHVKGPGHMFPMQTSLQDPVIKVHGNLEGWDYTAPGIPVLKVKYEAVDYSYSWNGSSWDETETVTDTSHTWQFDFYGFETQGQPPFVQNFNFGKAAGVAGEPTILEVDTNTPPGAPLAQPQEGYRLTNPRPSDLRITVESMGCPSPGGQADWIQTTYTVPYSCGVHLGFDQTKNSTNWNIGIDNNNEFFDKEEPYNVFHPTIFAQPEEPVEYYLDAGPANANKLFWMVGSLSGTEPGFIYDQGLPYPNIHFPLNLVGFIPGTPPQLDPYLSATLSANPGTFVSEFPHIGQFDGLGRAVVKFQLPALTMSLLYGAEVNHVYFILDGNDISGLSGIREIGFDPYLP